MRVLVAQDSPAERLALRALVMQLGHTCDEASNGADALARLSWSLYDAVFADASPTGTELCRRIRQRDGGPYVCTVVWASVDDRERALEAVRAGVDLCLTKPTDLIALEMGLILAARVVAAQRQLAQQRDALRAHQGEIADEPPTDQLGGLASLRRLAQDLQQVASLVTRHDVSACVAICDLDRFEAYRARFGRTAGEQMLERLGTILRASSRESDTVYRIGAEKLLVLLPGQTAVSASIAVERIRLGVEAAQVPHPDNQPYGVMTVSIGVVGLRAGAPVDVERLLAMADEALDSAQRSGRNRVVVHPASLHRLGVHGADWNESESNTM